jgi:hypothetical protein
VIRSHTIPAGELRNVDGLVEMAQRSVGRAA